MFALYLHRKQRGIVVLNKENNDTPDLLLTQFETYSKNYHGKLVNITTAYKPISSVDITFNNDNFPHLVGLHKLYGGSAKEQIKKIESGKLTLKMLQKHNDYGDMKDRLDHFSFIDKVFIREEIKECVQVSSADKKNRMKLDIVFLEDDTEKVMTLGIRKVYNGIYIPVTFYVSRNKKGQYEKSKRATIKKLIWK